MEKCKELLENNFKKEITEFGIQSDKNELTPLDELVQYAVLETEEEKREFRELQDQILNAIKVENRVLGEAIVKKKSTRTKNSTDSKDKFKSNKLWNQAYNWFLDRLVYTFLNRLFAIRVMEALDLLKESTLIPQLDLGNRSARMTKIQENNPGKSINEWQVMVIKDAFLELSQDIRVIFDEKDIATQFWPDGDVLAQLITYFNDVNPEIYKTEDCIGWFYHYYVLKIRKGHKTMSSHGSKSPANPYYLSILNTVYTPRWMVQILVDNSLGHWWQDSHPKSTIFSESPSFIKKLPINLESYTVDLLNLKIFDPACGSGNFLVYAFTKLVKMYEENYPEWDLYKIIKIILTQNLYGVDINRRPAQLSAIALYILTKRLIKDKTPELLATFKMPPVNIISCDIRIPKDDKNRILFLQKFKDIKVQKILKDLIDQFDNADQLGSLIDIRSLQTEINKLKQELELKKKSKGRLDKYLPKDYLESTEYEYSLNLVDIVENELIDDESQNIGLQLFGKQAKKAASLAQILMQKYDIVISNPPFGLSMDATKEKLRKYYPYSYRDLIATFIDQSYRLLKNKGYIGMVSDRSFMQLPKFEKFRRNILLKKLYIQYFIITDYGCLPDAGNHPILYVLRNIKPNDHQGLYRYNQSSLNQIESIRKDITLINEWKIQEELPNIWKLLTQGDFEIFPRATIDLTFEEHLRPLINFFVEYPRLDIKQLNAEEKKKSKNKHVARSYGGINTGLNDVFIHYWFEIAINKIRKAEKIEKIEEIVNNTQKQFVPIAKGGGDIRYYINNAYILWWNKEAISEMKKYYCVFRNLSLLSISHLNWSLVSKARQRFTIAQKGIIFSSASNGIFIFDNIIDKYSLLAYLNSKMGFFYGYLQNKGRFWPAGIIARYPIPIEFLNQKKVLKLLAKESFQLRRDWDTGYPMSPIFSESLIDKVIKNNEKNLNFGKPKTGHLFCEQYRPSKSDTSIKINQIMVKSDNHSINDLLNAVEERFNLLIKRLNEVDEEINQNLYELIDNDTAKALDNYYNTFVGDLGWEIERETLIKDFLLSNLVDLIKRSSKGIISLNSFKESDLGLYKSFIDLLCQKFDLNTQKIQPLIKELENFLKKDLKRWIAEDFFFYHCQRFGGRPIIWHFCSRLKSNQENAIDLFIDYHQITENTLPNIRVEYLEPLLKIYEQRKVIGTLPLEEVPKIDELEESIRAFTALEKGYKRIPNPNALTGKNVQKGEGDDKTWEWLFSEAEMIIKNGYKPDHFKGVLINIIPLCIELTDAKKKDFPIEYYSICPKGTLKQVLKKMSNLDQLKNSLISNNDDENIDKKEILN